MKVAIRQMPIELTSARMKSWLLKIWEYAVPTGLRGSRLPSLRVSSPLRESEMIQTTGMKA